MGAFRRNLQEKVDSRREKRQRELTGKERLKREGQKLENALVFLEKTTQEAQEGWYIESCKELTGSGLMGKLGILRKKLQRKSLHWYLEPVCDDQSVYNQKLLQALTAIEDFARAQADWNREAEARREAETKRLKEELAALREQNARMAAMLSKTADDGGAGL